LDSVSALALANASPDLILNSDSAFLSNNLIFDSSALEASSNFYISN